MRIDEVIASNMSAQYKQWADILTADCAPFFSKTKNILWRGLGRSTVPFGRYPCPRNRAPRDTASLIHEIANQWFIENTGIKYRADAVFATGWSPHAQGYGNVFSMFPIGDFRFCWSPTIADFTFDLAENFPDLQDDDPDAENKIYNAMDHAMYQTTDLKRAIQSKHEVMVHCDEYYVLAFDHTNPVLNEVWNNLGM